MKYPKHRANMYVVVRVDGIEEGYHTAILGTFSDLVEADDFKDACAAEWFDKIRHGTSTFEVRLSTYYG